MSGFLLFLAGLVIAMRLAAAAWKAFDDRNAGRAAQGHPALAGNIDGSPGVPDDPEKVPPALRLAGVPENG